ncbi:indole-3-glycerol-phosphate synthase, partial [Candidatus Bathyarchaeota archaeon]|nr:indole-3-glycerol-phosphate synthase [Candidatus Bathyarchaeota archaeon]
TKREFMVALETEADLVGINNRDLKTLRVDLDVTRRILQSIGECGKIVVSESGIQTPEDIRFLRSCGARAFLVGSAIMKASDIEEKVRELVMAYEDRED